MDATLDIASWATALGALVGGVTAAAIKLRRDARAAKLAERAGAQQERTAAAEPWRNLYKGCEADRKKLQGRVDEQGETIAQLQHRLGRVEGTLNALHSPHPLGRRHYDGLLPPREEVGNDA